VADESKCQPLQEWIQGGSEKECRSCVLAIVTPWYRDALRQHGLPEEASTIERMAESSDPIQVARALDAVKGRVPPELQQTLRQYDCEAQQVEE
jgi:hypothetical protein